MENEKTKSAPVYVRAIVDVAGVLQDRPRPLKNAKTPAPVSFDSGQMIVTTTRGTADQGDIAFDACTGDIVRFFAKSGSNNFEHAVLIDAILRAGNDEITKDFKSVNLSQTRIAPASEAADHTVEAVEQEFWFWQCTVAGEGSQGFSLILALYDRDEEGQPRFAGFYRWDLQLTVLSNPPPDEDTQQQERTP